MSTKYPGGFITKSPVAPTSTAASGIWTLDQQQQAQKAGTWPSPPMFIEDLFSTWLYTGTGVAQTITNGIDVSGKGGLVWIKARSVAEFNVLVDTARGASNALRSSSTAAQINDPGRVSAFTSSGFSIGTDGEVNGSGNTQASWTFAKQPKFFDVVTYTGNGASQAISHNLGSVPGCIMVKRTDATGNWIVWHTSLNQQTGFINLESTAAASTNVEYWNNTAPTASVFSVGPISGTNGSGATYVAYLFAHNAGGFPASGAGSTNGISCGSVVTDGLGGATVNLGYEPQWVLWKRADGVGNWHIIDTMRGMSQTGASFLYPNTSGAEGVANGSPSPFTATATGFQTTGYWINDSLHIYIAIRRGPMKTPTTGTSVFTPVAYAGDSSATRLVNAGVNIDANISARRSGPDFFVQSRLTGVPYLRTRSVNAETSSSGTNGIPTILTSENNKFGFIAGSSGLSNVNETGSNYVDWAFTRAPTFFDVVCYTGTGANRTVTHNLAAAPELMLVKQRSGTEVWSVYYGDNTDYLVLNSDQATTDSNIYWNDTSPTSSVFTLGTGNEVNSSGSTYVAYLFATCAGVSKVGSFTGTGATQVINCGFTGGARFVLIKATSTTGAWYVWDSARGIVAGNDPYLALNIGTAEVTTTDWVDTATSGFELSNAGGNLANSNGVSYIFLAIA